MGRGDLERLSKEELIELVLRLQRPEKTSHTSSKPPSTDCGELRTTADGRGEGGPGHQTRPISPLGQAQNPGFGRRIPPWSVTIDKQPASQIEGA